MSELELASHITYIKFEFSRFGEDSVEKMVKWGLSTLPPDPDLSILEIGCGNGTLLSAMAQAGYAQKSLVGIDYSEDAVKLAQLVAESKGLDSIAFHRCDFLNESPPLPDSVSKTTDAEETSSWDLLLDKGTFDAIALGAKAPEGKNPAEAYPPRVSRLLKPGGMFLITCELIRTFRLQFFVLKRHKHDSLQLYGGRTQNGLSKRSGAAVSVRDTQMKPW